MIIHYGDRYPFPDANVKIQEPFDAKTRDPKTWGTQGTAQGGPGQLDDPAGMFWSRGVLLNDLVFICSSNPFYQVATTCGGAVTDASIALNWLVPENLTNIIYKVGEGPTHTLTSFIEIIRDRAKAPYTIHWASIWCPNLFSDFNDDETGDVYVIDPQFKKKMKKRNRVAGKWEARPAPP